MQRECSPSRPVSGRSTVPRDTACRCASQPVSVSEYQRILKQCQRNHQQWYDGDFPTPDDTEYLSKMTASSADVEWKRTKVRCDLFHTENQTYWLSVHKRG